MSHPMIRGVVRAPLHAAALLLLAAAPAAPVGAQSATAPAALLARAAATYRGARTIDARFEQTLTNPLTGRTNTTRGELIHGRPNLLSVRFDTPAQDRIVADGSSIWLYLPSSAPGQVIRMPARGPGRAPVTDPLDQILATPPDRYRATDAGTARIAGHATRAVTVVPTGRASFTRATVWVDDADGTVRQLEVTEPSGLVRRVTITAMRTNVSVPPRTFRFVPPAGVRVVDRRALTGG